MGFSTLLHKFQYRIQCKIFTKAHPIILSSLKVLEIARENKTPVVYASNLRYMVIYQGNDKREKMIV